MREPFQGEPGEAQQLIDLGTQPEGEELAPWLTEFKARKKKTKNDCSFRNTPIEPVNPTRSYSNAHE